MFYFSPVYNNNNNNKGRKISDISGDDHDSSYLFQWILVLIQHYNAILLHESFTEENRPDPWPLEC